MTLSRGPGALTFFRHGDLIAARTGAFACARAEKHPLNLNQIMLA